MRILEIIQNMWGETYGQDLSHDATSLHNASCFQERTGCGKNPRVKTICNVYTDFAVIIRSCKNGGGEKMRCDIAYVSSKKVCAHKVQMRVKTVINTQDPRMYRCFPCHKNKERHRIGTCGFQGSYSSPEYNHYNPKRRHDVI